MKSVVNVKKYKQDFYYKHELNIKFPKINKYISEDLLVKFQFCK